MSRPPLHRTSRRRSSRRLPWWIRRGFRVWQACARKLGRGDAAERGAVWSPVFGAGGELELPVPPCDERRCGWFDSSLDLQEGLAVSEHQPDDPVVAELPVMAWVQLQLCGWRPEMAPAAQAA